MLCLGTEKVVYGCFGNFTRCYMWVFRKVLCMGASEILQGVVLVGFAKCCVWVFRKFVVYRCFVGHG